VNKHNVYRCKLEANATDATGCVLVWLLTRLYFFSRILMTIAMDLTIYSHRLYALLLLYRERLSRKMQLFTSVRWNCGRLFRTTSGCSTRPSSQGHSCIVLERQPHKVTLWPQSCQLYTTTGARLSTKWYESTRPESLLINHKSRDTFP